MKNQQTINLMAIADTNSPLVPPNTWCSLCYLEFLEDIEEQPLHG